MKFSRECLNKYIVLDQNANSSHISSTLTKIGFPTEIITKRPIGLECLRLARVLSAKPFVNELRLLLVEYVNSVSNKIEQIEVVCGDTKVQIGDVVPLILIGEVLPSTGKKLKSREIHGVTSPGMLCSDEELGLCEEGESDGVRKFTHIHNTHNNIIFTPILDAIYPCGDIFDCEVTYNRGDMLSVLGVARELSAAGLGELMSVNHNIAERCKTLQVYITEAAHSTLNGLYVGWYVLNKPEIKIAEHVFEYDAKFLRQISQTTGIDIVDMGNEIVHEIGQPLHVYDMSKLVNKLTYDTSIEGEKFIALNGKEYTLPAGILVARDDVGIVSLIGIIGSARTACTNQTTDVFLEVANMSASYMSEAIQKLGINTKSAQLFLHEVDSAAMKQSVACFEKKLEDIVSVGSNMFMSYEKNIHNTNPADKTGRTISVDVSLAQHICGVLWNESQFTAILSKLGFAKIASHESSILTYSVPSHRFDIDCPHVLISEYLRMIGYDKIPQTEIRLDAKCDNAKQALLKRISAFLSNQLMEVVTYKAVDENNSSRCESLKLNNPMNGVHYMRRSLLPSILDMYYDQLKRGRACKGMYEISDGFEYLNDKTNGNSCGEKQLSGDDTQIQNSNTHLDQAKIIQTLYTSAVVNADIVTWPDNSKAFNLTSMQILLQQLLANTGIDIQYISYLSQSSVQTAETSNVTSAANTNVMSGVNVTSAIAHGNTEDFMRAGHCIWIFWKKNKIGLIGEINTDRASTPNVKLYGFELNMSMIIDKCLKVVPQSYVDYQYIYVKDFSVKLDGANINTKAEDLLKKVASSNSDTNTSNVSSAVPNMTFVPIGAENSKIEWSIFDIYPESITKTRNIGIRAKIYSMTTVSTQDMSKWYDDMLKLLSC